jgi:LGFP repeat
MTPIQKKYEETGGVNGQLGSSITAETTTPNGLGIYQEFQNGIIYFTTDYGACILGSRIVEKWKSDSVAKALTANNSTTVRDYLGFPIADTSTHARNGQVCYFERGMIVDSTVVYGQIYAIYRKNADINGWLGFPKSDEQISANGGRVSFFEQADIYWHPNAGAFEVHGGIREKYNALGASGSFLGYPISDENSILKNGSEIGRSNNFEFGTIFWSRQTGAFEMHGLLIKSYMDKFGGPAGELGFPTSDELGSAKGVFRFNNFQNGVLTYRIANSNIRKVSNLRLTINRLETDEDNDDLFVQSISTLRVNGRELQRVDKNFGEYSNQGTKDLSATEGFVGDFLLRDGNATLSVFMKAWDVDGGINFGDDEIASFTKTFSIDTLWETTTTDLEGNTLQTAYHGPDGNFKSNLRIDLDGFDVNPFDSSNFRRDLFWQFRNPKIEKLDFDTYAATFSDVEPDDSPVFHPFNHIYYQAAYKSSAETGTCFGVCLEAIYALKGRSASREPISQFSFDEQRKRDIAIKFGFNNGNYSVLCLSKGASIAGGHAVVPYRWDDSNPNEWLIFVANPNTPFSQDNNDSTLDSVIRIDPNTNTFVYNHSASQKWSGGAGVFNGGRMFGLPYCELSTQPRTPFWEVVLTLITGGVYLIFAGDAEIDQITDENSQTFYGTDGRINTDNASRTKNIFPIETLSEPEDFGMTSSAAVQDFTFLNPAIFRFMQTNKSKMFFVKSEKNKGQIYQEPVAVSDIMVMQSPFLFNHVSVAAQSQTFAVNQTVNDLSQIVARRPHLQLLKNKSLKFDIKGSSSGEYAFGFASGKSKVMIHSDTASGLIDQVVIDSLNTAGQAISFKANDNAANKKVNITLTSFDEKRSYQINNIQIEAGQTFTLQHNDACKELILHNSDRAISFDLKLFLDKNQTPVLVKENIGLDALSVVNLQPDNWISIINQDQNAALKIDSFDKIGGTLIGTRLV